MTNRAVAYVAANAPDSCRMRDEQPNGQSTIRFWQRGGGYDRNLWLPRYVWEMIDYIHANPVRRGLCETPVQWAWSSAGFYAGMGDGPLGVDVEHIPGDLSGLAGAMAKSGSRRTFSMLTRRSTGVKAWYPDVRTRRPSHVLHAHPLEYKRESMAPGSSCSSRLRFLVCRPGGFQFVDGHGQ